ncbi:MULTISPECIES: class II fructose-bisphosphate aldolase [Dermabacter]|uniref:Fructose-bisphosphate aldolase n=2 Tax=Dermabacter TaxID=36739 RepID=A0A1B0ZK66_9MICO|nr:MULTISPECIES: class II fructose-bisphosphate aldolase [Dermabacter]SHW97467.1 fructose-bisphosphate aldolase, Fba [Mycobacteroides abscessus subsp. abscessus]ANP28414.1 fructose-bisphosphate aldolase, class II [Dermabacter vaginalis]ATH95952.1 class II fructose-bisphosphate aldolase [Dermabacter jinjuensis]MCG7443611.1 class II fructose-bisphosphate aldolase [Dermabacter vaginalis]MCT1715766.1 class II fructose-bisphosphate aldolase [Dermabacter hominis]
MPVATPEQFNEMIDRAKEGKFAYPAINVSSSQTAIAALQGFVEAESDGIIQVSVGGAEYLSGSTVKNRVRGSIALAKFIHEVAEDYNITVGVHTDHCAKENLPTWVEPLIEWDLNERVNKGLNPLFTSHMWDGSAVPVDENLEIAKRLLEKTVEAKKVLEIEVGVVGGEEDGYSADVDESKLFSTPEDGLKTAEALGLGENGRYITALTFGNVHGVYKPGNVRLTPSILLDIQKAVGEKYGKDMPFDLVMHGGSGSTLEEIQEAVDNGVIKMNVDTDTQYAFSRPVAGHMLENYEGVLKIDGEVGNKKMYDPRSWGKKAEAGMAKRVVEACENLRSAGHKM